MTNITAEELQSAVKTSNCGFIAHHTCGICNCPVGYVFFSDEPFFDGGCDCCSFSNAQGRTWQEVADFINIQPDVDKLRLFNALGIEVKPTTDQL